MKTIYPFVLSCALMTILLSSCGTTTPAPQEMPAPTETPTPRMNAMGSPVPTVRTPLPTPTHEPTATPDFPAAATQAARNTASALTQQATWDAQAATQVIVSTMWAPFGDCYLGLSPTFISPNGRWALCDPITIADSSGDRYHLTFANMSEFPFTGEWFIGYYHWTGDGQYLYMAPIIMVDGGANPWVHNGFMLVRINLQGSQLQESVLVPYSLPCDGCLPVNYAFSVSPTDRRLAYVNFQHTDEMTIIDLRDNSESVIPLEPGHTAAGWFDWSEDGLSLVYTLVDFSDMDCNWRESIRWLDIQSETTVDIIDDVEVNGCEDRDHPVGDYEVVEVTAEAIRFERDGIFWMFDLATRRMVEQPAP